jgi:cytochrome b
MCRLSRVLSRQMSSPPLAEAGIVKGKNRLWDLPVRLVHWALVVTLIVSWWSAENLNLERHRQSGYVMLGLIVFRLNWGIVGSKTARFSQFLKGPRTVVAFLRGSHQPGPGHSPVGALSVVAMLVFIFMQILLGLFAVDIDGIESGPLSQFVDFETGRAIAEWHNFNFDIIVGLIGLHLAAIAFYTLVRRKPLIGAMITGGVRPGAQESDNLRRRDAGLAFAGILLSVAVV